MTARREANSIAASSSDAGSAGGAPAIAAWTWRPSGSRHSAVRLRPDRSSAPAVTEPLALLRQATDAKRSVEFWHAAPSILSDRAAAPVAQAGRGGLAELNGQPPGG